jgi:hypothetical protein
MVEDIETVTTTGGSPGSSAARLFDDSTGALRAGAYRGRIENRIRAGNTTLPSMAA